MIQHRRKISRSRDKKGASVNPNVVSMENSVNTTATGLAPATSAATSASSASGSASASASSSAQQQQCDTSSSNFFSSSPSPSVYNPGLLHRVVLPSGVGESNNQTHIPSPFEVAQRALAAQVEAYNRASAQMGLASMPQMQQQQEQQQAFDFPPAPEAQSLWTSVATDAWQGRMAMSACHTTDDSSESSSSNPK